MKLVSDKYNVNTWNGFERIWIDSYRGILYTIMKLPALHQLQFINAFCGDDGWKSAAVFACQ
jgi:hypothetical protein